MGYVIAAIVVVLIVAGFILFLVLNATRKGAGANTADPSARQSDRGGPPGIGEDPTPLGDTTEHAGTQSPEGVTAEDPESAERGQDPADDRPVPGGDGPQRPARPEDRQLRDAGAESAAAPERDRS